LLRPTSEEIAKSLGISIGANRNNSQWKPLDRKERVVDLE
jgi:hypothetical protein